MPRFRMAREYVQFPADAGPGDRITITTVEDPENSANQEMMVITSGDFVSNAFANDTVIASFNPNGRKTTI